MKLQQVDMHGAGRAIRVHLFIGETDTQENSRQWLEGKVEINVVGTMDEADLQRAAMTHLRNVLDAEIAALRTNGELEKSDAA